MRDRRALLTAALGFALVRVPEPLPPALIALRRWLGSWTGIGAVVTGMLRQGYDVDLRSYEQGWRATFLHREHIYRPWVGQVLRFHATPWQAVQRAAWQALNAQPSRDLTEEHPPVASAIVLKAASSTPAPSGG